MAPFPRILDSICQSGLCQVGEHRLVSLPTSTRTLPVGISQVIGRQASTATVTVIPDSGNSNTGSSGLTPGAIAGIVIGSIVGFLLLLWILRSFTNLGAPPQERERWYHDVDPPRRSSRSSYHHRPHSSHSHHSHHSHHSGGRRSHGSEMRTDAVLTAPVVVREDREKRVRRPDPAYVYDDPRRGRRGRYYESY